MIILILTVLIRLIIVLHLIGQLIHRLSPN